MPDMLVKLYNLPEEFSLDYLSEKGIYIKRPLPPDIHQVTKFVRVHFSEAWASEVSVALTKVNPTCFIAIKNKKVIGFACFDATAKGFFGPTGVDENYRSYGIGKALLMKCLLAMRDEGYAYAIIGGVDKAQPFYEKVCQAIVIPNTNQTVYSRMIQYN